MRLGFIGALIIIIGFFLGVKLISNFYEKTIYEEIDKKEGANGKELSIKKIKEITHKLSLKEELNLKYLYYVFLDIGIPFTLIFLIKIIKYIGYT